MGESSSDSLLYFCSIPLAVKWASLHQADVLQETCRILGQKEIGRVGTSGQESDCNRVWQGKGTELVHRMTTWVVATGQPARPAWWALLTEESLLPWLEHVERSTELVHKVPVLDPVDSSTGNFHGAGKRVDASRLLMCAGLMGKSASVPPRLPPLSWRQSNGHLQLPLPSARAVYCHLVVFAGRRIRRVTLSVMASGCPHCITDRPIYPVIH